MHVIAYKRLQQFWESRKVDAAQAQKDLEVWYKQAENAGAGNFAELKNAYPSADMSGDCVVFDVGNNRYRLIGRVRYRGNGTIFVLLIMDHAEYDRRPWADECGCHKPPPRKRAGRKKGGK